MKKIIHLESLDGNSFCGGSHGIITPEHPRGSKIDNVCQTCFIMYNEAKHNEFMKYQQDQNNRTRRQKLHDCLEEMTHYGESDMAVVYDLFLFFVTLGLIIPAKHIAKVLLKVGL